MFHRFAAAAAVASVIIAAGAIVSQFPPRWLAAWLRRFGLHVVVHLQRPTIGRWPTGLWCPVVAGQE